LWPRARPVFRPLLEAVAAAERPTPAVLARAVDDGELLLDAAIAEGAVTLGRESVVRFAHPLLASAVYGAIPAARRRVVHARLAEASRGAEERARHLALAALEPDVEVARLLDEAARHAQARGAPDAAAELAHQAFRLTPDFDVEGRANRMLAVAVSVFHSGDVAAAAAVLDEQHPADASGPKRAETLLLRYLVEQDAALVSRFAAEALEHVRDDDPLRIRILILLSSLAVHFDDPETSTALARRALADAEKIAEPALLALALAGVAKREAAAGGGDPALAERAFTLAAEHGWMQGALSTRVVLAGQRLLDGDLGGARNLLEVELDETFRSGREDARWPILSALVPLELQAGNWDTAERHFDAAQDLVIDGDHWGDSITVSQGGLIAALRGRVDDARRFASEGIRYGESAHARSLVTMNRAVLGFLEHSLGDSGSAWQVLSDPPAAVDRWLPAYPGFPEPMPEAVEALVALGRLEEADAILAKFATRWPDHRWAVPAELRCRALLLLACRHAEAALDAAEEAVVASEAVGFPLDRGRALLVAGETLRRLGERRRAAEKLEAAKGVFSELGAPLWFARAENELRRASPRPRRDRELTSAERRVAALVASGRTNREVAAQLFTTVGTVEAHLTRIYRKLGLRSRTELARRVADAKLDLDTE